MKKINVIGLGYIGLPTAAMFAKNKVHVHGVDVKESIVNIINEGKIHIEEPGLKEVINDVVKDGYLEASLEPVKSDAFIISVPTPNNKDKYKSCDITYVLEATKKILPYLKKGNLVVIESTIAPRTTEDYVLPLIESKGFVVGKDIYLAHCPERVLPGQILYELVNNNRIIGGITPACTEKASILYSTFVKGKLIKTEAKTAEMSKLMENTYRDVNIALSNELAKICNKLDINVLDVIKMANEHPRVNILSPGPGVGGHCLAVDPYYIYAKAPLLAKVIKTSRDVNVSMPKYVVNNIEKLIKKDKSKIITIFGCTYKANVDDIREAPALEVIRLLKEKGYTVNIHDPHVKNNEYLSFSESLKDSSLLVITVNHDEFKKLKASQLSSYMKNVKVFDCTGSINIENLDVINYGNLWENK